MYTFIYTIISLTYWFLLKYDPSICVKDSKCHLMIPKSEIHVHYDEVPIEYKTLQHLFIALSTSSFQPHLSYNIKYSCRKT